MTRDPYSVLGVTRGATDREIKKAYRMARALAEQAGLPGTAGSDFHQVQDLASCCVGFEKLPGDGQELAEAIRQGRFTREIFRGI